MCHREALSGKSIDGPAVAYSEKSGDVSGKAGLEDRVTSSAPADIYLHHLAQEPLPSI